jgi:hypothetical protein
MTPITAPTLAPLVLPRAPTEPAFTGQMPPASTATAPRKDAQPALLPNVTPPTEANVTHPVTATEANVTLAEPNAAQNVLPLTDARRDLADDFAPLRVWLERYGRLTIDPRDPPWEDPRPDLVNDHSRWWLLLEAAYRLDGQDPDGLYGALFGMRCCGARLEIASPTSWRLVQGDALSAAEYQELRQRYLLPHTAALTQLLSAAGAASIAHERPAPPGKFTGHTPTAPATSAPRKSSADFAAQPALLEVERSPEPVRRPGGDW